jgi:hypothetical protein
MLHSLGNDNEAIRQNVTLDVACVGDHGVLWHIGGKQASLEF